jgi:EAL domain-containing protein (putative c-di-GMP-specific phosphodiesterase class I)
LTPARNSPEHGDIGPAEFIPLAESSGLVVPIGLWALDQACAQLSRWQAAFPAARRITLAVNVSMRQLVLPDFDDRVKAILHKHGLAARSIEIELTETAAMQDPQQTIAVLGRLRQLGLRLALDDFGTGHSSLGWLQKLPIDILKIDKSFLPGLAGQAPDAAPATPPERNIVRPILALAHAMDLDTVAEGVETTEQWTRLETLGCKIGQGYIFSQSLSSDEAEKLLSNSADFFYPRTPE